MYAYAVLLDSGATEKTKDTSLWLCPNPAFLSLSRSDKTLRVSLVSFRSLSLYFFVAVWLAAWQLHPLGALSSLCVCSASFFSTAIMS